jgi:hypothetical protein
MGYLDAVLSNEPDWSWKGHLVDDIRVDLKHFTHWKLSYVRREANQAAHLLARLATRQKIEKLWPSAPPSCIAETIVTEQSIKCNTFSSQKKKKKNWKYPVSYSGKIFLSPQKVKSQKYTSIVQLMCLLNIYRHFALF